MAEQSKCVRCGDTVALGDRRKHLEGHDPKAADIDANDVIKQFVVPDQTERRARLFTLRVQALAVVETTYQVMATSDRDAKIQARTTVIPNANWLWGGIQYGSEVIEATEA